MDNGNTPLLQKLTRRQYAALVALFVLFASFFIVPTALAQTTPAPPGTVQTSTTGEDLSQGAAATDNTVPDPYYNANQYTTLVQQQAEQNTEAVAQNVEQQLWPDFGAYNETYDGLAAFWGDDIISNFFSNIGQLIGKWLSEFINGWVADAVQFLTGFLRVFVLNPNIAVNGLGNNGQADDISPYIRQGADVMYGIAVDLLLLLFILCIWKYWAEAAWRGGGNLMGAVGRLIFTAGLLLAWPTIYAFEIQISNEMIKAIYFNSADQVAMLDAAMAAAVKGGLVAGAGLLANATAPVAGQVFGGMLGSVAGAGGPMGLALGTVGSLVAFVGLIVYLILGGILIAELIYILVLKSIQTALLCAQYMFAPIFLVFFAVPDTENVTSGFVKSFVEVSLWTFVWVGMLKILVIVVLSNFNPWGKIVMAVGVLQLMIQVPSFLARAQISPMSDFISAGLVTGGLLKGGSALGNLLSNRAMHFANAVGNFGYAGAKGAPKSQATELNGLANDVARPDLLKDIRGAQATGAVPGAKGPNDKKGDGTGGAPPGSQPLNPHDPNAPKGPKNGKDGEDPTKAGVPPAKDLNAAKTDANGLPINPTAKDGALGTPAGTPGGANANPADKGLNPAGEALANAGKNAALGAVVAGAAGAGLAAVESGAALKGAQSGAGTEEQRSATAAQQQAAEALKKLQNDNTAGVGDKGVKGPVDANGKPLKVDGGKIDDAAGPGGAKAKGEVAGAKGIVDPTVSATVKGAAGGKGAGPGATEADAKGKELSPGDIKPPTTATNPGAGNAADATKGAGQQMEMEFERDGAAAVAAASVAGLNGPPKIGDLKDQTDGKGTAGAGPNGGKTTVSGGKLDAAGNPINVAAGTTDVTGKLIPKKPGETVGGKTVAPSLSTTGLNTAVSGAGTGKNIDPTTGMGTSDIVHDASDPGAPITTPQAKTEVHTVGNANQLASGQTVQTNATGKVVTGVGGGTTAPPIQNVNSQFTQATGAKGSAPVGQNINTAAAAVPSMAAAAGGGAAGGGGGDGKPPIFDHDNNPEGPAGTTPPAGEAGMGTQPASNRTQGSMYDGYMQAGYRHVPYRVAAAAIRLAQGATLAPSRSGKPEVIQDNQGHMMHVRFGEGATDEQKAMQIMSGAYGELMSTDAEAYDAARQSSIDAGEHKPVGLKENIAAGILAYNGSSWTQTAAAKQRFGRSMAKHATLGAQSYVSGESGNAYTEYLTNRYGPMSDEQQAWGVHIMTDASSPESGWSWRMGPATEALIQNGLPISPVHRAVAANPSVLKAQPWLRGAAIRGGVQYMQSRAEQTIPEGTNGLVQDAWYGNQAQAMAPEVVNTVGAITLALGEKACADTGTIDKVAAMIGPQGRPEDAVGAYNALKGGNVVMARMQAQYSGPTGGGGGGGFNMGSTTMNGGNMPGGPSDIGGVQTSVSGSIVGGGGGPRNNAEVDVLFGQSNPGPSNFNPNNIAPPNMSMPPASGSTHVNFRMQGGGVNGGGGQQQNYTMRVPGQNVGSTNEQVVIGNISGGPSGGGGGNAPDQVIGVDVDQEMNGGGGSYSAAPSGGDIQQAFAGALQQHGGSDNMVQRVIADLRSTGMQWNQIFDPARSDSDPGKYQLLQTAMECQSRDIPVQSVAIAARAMGSSAVTPQHVEIVQNMLDADPRWSPQSISYSDVYTAQALVEAHRADPGLYGNPYLSKDYVDTVKSDPRFTPRPVPQRNPIGQIVDYARSKVPEDLLMRKTQEGYGGGGGGRGGFGGGNRGGGFGGGNQGGGNGYV